MSATLPAPADLSSSLRPAKAPFGEVVLICRKCSRKLGGKGKALRKALKQSVKSGRWGKARLIETGCFSLCPKRRQVLASSRTLRERRLLVIEPSSPVDEVLAYLLGSPGG